MLRTRTRRIISIPQASFNAVVNSGALLEAGMPIFDEFTDEQLDQLRQYIRSRAQVLRQREAACASMKLT
jgi:quinohemoprotein ethanol dehydrogenase